jgi:hypothetical protein
MHKIDFEEKENILWIKIEGIYNLEQANKAHDEIKAILKNVKRGFTVLTDMSLLQEMSPDSFKSISKTMDMFNEYGVGHVVRIVPDSSRDIGFNIMDTFHYSSDVKTRTFDSMEKATEYVNTLKPQNT